MLERVFKVDLEHCPTCGGELKIIATILAAPVIEVPPSAVARRRRPAGAGGRSA